MQIGLAIHSKRNNHRVQLISLQVLIPSICCLHKSTALEELYLEKADSVAITTYLLAHTLKHLNNLRVLALPKQCDDDVASIIGSLLHIFPFQSLALCFALALMTTMALILGSPSNTTLRILSVSPFSLKKKSVKVGRGVPPKSVIPSLP